MDSGTLAASASVALSSLRQDTSPGTRYLMLVWPTASGGAMHSKRSSSFSERKRCSIWRPSIFLDIGHLPMRGLLRKYSATLVPYCRRRSGETSHIGGRQQSRVEGTRCASSSDFHAEMTPPERTEEGPALRSGLPSVDGTAPIRVETVTEKVQRTPTHRSLR